MLSEIWERWLHAYCRIRGYSALEPVAEGLYLEVAKRQQSGRFFVSGFDEAVIRGLLPRIQEPSTYVELPAPPEILAEHLPKGWRFGEAAYLMACDLRTPAGEDAGKGYWAKTDIVAGQASVSIRAAGDGVAASGTCLVAGDEAIFDQISTEIAHRRRGLGTAVMLRLAAEARRGGATTGLLVATLEGRRLYEALGWTVLSEVTTLVSPAPVSRSVYRIDQGSVDGRFRALAAAA